jgi:hypothetical protein
MSGSSDLGGAGRDHSTRVFLRRHWEAGKPELRNAPGDGFKAALHVGGPFAGG